MPHGNRKATRTLSIKKTLRSCCYFALACVWGWNAYNDGLVSKSTTAVAPSTRPATTSTSGVVKEYYHPAPVEKYIVENTQKLGYNRTGNKSSPSGCGIWKDESLTPFYKELMLFREELEVYQNKLKAFMEQPDRRIPDVRLGPEDQKEQRCETLNIMDLDAIFAKSKQLSKSNKHGFLEPLLPPMRHPEICFGNSFQKRLMDMGYLIQDFSAMCRSLHKQSRIVMIDMGASLEYHNRIKLAPAVYLAEVYGQFGMPFDHIYAFEITETKPASVFERVPKHLLGAYHWINVGVDASPDAKLNPLNLLLENFSEDDLIIVKLDIDSPGIEESFATQIRDHPKLTKLIDHFYFEHHVFISEFNGRWMRPDRWSMEDSLNLFYDLRQKGVASHYWV